MRRKKSFSTIVDEYTAGRRGEKYQVGAIVQAELRDAEVHLQLFVDDDCLDEIHDTIRVAEGRPAETRLFTLSSEFYLDEHRGMARADVTLYAETGDFDCKWTIDV